jgi:hypothetical protein
MMDDLGLSIFYDEVVTVILSLIDGEIDEFIYRDGNHFSRVLFVKQRQISAAADKTDSQWGSYQDHRLKFN